MHNNAPHIAWPQHVEVDPYPFILEALNKVFEFAKTVEGSIGEGPETNLIDQIHRVAIGLTAEYDPTSLPMWTAPFIEENS